MNRFTEYRRGYRDDSRIKRRRAYRGVRPGCLPNWELHTDDDIGLALAFLSYKFRGPRINWFWNKRLTTTAGQAWHDNIDLSPWLWQFANQKQRLWVLIHEACHVFRPNTVHGKEWQDAMKLCGALPQCYHTIKVKLSCFCATRLLIPMHWMARETRYCDMCGGPML